MTDKITLSRRALLASIGATGAAAMGGAGTFATYSDSSDTTLEFESGSIRLRVEPKQLQFQQGSGSELTATVQLTNYGTLTAGQLALSDVELDGSEEVQAGAAVTTFTYRGNDVLDTLETIVGDPNENGLVDLSDLSEFLANDVLELEGLVDGDGLSPNANETVSVTIGVTLDYAQITENSQELSVTVDFAARQRALADDASVSGAHETRATESGSNQTNG